MADKRELLLAIKGKDDGASKALRDVGDASDRSADKLDNMRTGLDALDRKIGDTKTTIASLRQEVLKTGDLELFKDINKQTARLRNLGKQRDFLIAGQDAASGFAASFGGRLGPLMARLPVGPAGLAIGAGLAAAALPAMGALITAGVVGGAGIGGVVGGLVIASKDARVQSAAKRMSDNIGRQLQDAAAPFVPAALKAINIVERGFGDLGDVLRDVFAGSAGYLEPLTRGLMGAIREVAPGFAKAVRAAQPIITVISNNLPRIGDAIGDVFEQLSENAGTAAVALDYLFKTVEGGIRFIGGTLDVLANIFKTVDIFLGVTQGRAADVLSKYAVADAQAKQSSEGLAGILPGLAGGFKNVGDKAGGAKTEVKGFADQIRGIGSPALTAQQAMISFEAAIDDATAAIKENGRATNIGTEKGRANRTALLGIASSAKDAAAAIYEQTGSQDQANAVINRARTALYNQARAAGYSKEQAAALTGQLLGIPNVNRKVNVDTGRAEARVESLSERLARIRSKTVTITVIEQRRIDARTGGSRGMSAGGPVMGPGPKGVDSVSAVLAPGEYVLNAKDVDRLGGTAAVDALRRSLRTGEPSRPARTPTPAGGSRVELSDASLERLARMIARAMSSVTVTATVQDSGRLATVLGRAG